MIEIIAQNSMYFVLAGFIVLLAVIFQQVLKA